MYRKKYWVVLYQAYFGCFDRYNKKIKNVKFLILKKKNVIQAIILVNVLRLILRLIKYIDFQF